MGPFGVPGGVDDLHPPRSVILKFGGNTSICIHVWKRICAKLLGFVVFVDVLQDISQTCIKD